MKTSILKSKKGFTLIEMLAVLGILAMLIALATPTLLDVVRSTRLNSAGDGLVNRLSLAQQSAVSTSSEVEVRFYRYMDRDSDRPSDSSFYAYQVVQSKPGGEDVALSEVYYLESGIIISAQEELSPLLSTTNPQSSNTQGDYLFTPPGGSTPEDVNYAAMRFYPDGSMRMLTSSTNNDASLEDVAKAYTVPQYDESFVTIIESRFSLNDQIPNNYYCIQIDSYTGRTRVYRP